MTKSTITSQPSRPIWRTTRISVKPLWSNQSINPNHCCFTLSTMTSMVLFMENQTLKTMITQLHHILKPKPLSLSSPHMRKSKAWLRTTFIKQWNFKPPCLTQYQIHPPPRNQKPTNPQTKKPKPTHFHPLIPMFAQIVSKWVQASKLCFTNSKMKTVLHSNTS